LFIDIKSAKNSEAIAAGDMHQVRLTRRRPLDDLL
jgi:hypothetical protein